MCSQHISSTKELNGSPFLLFMNFFVVIEIYKNIERARWKEMGRYGERERNEQKRET
jgi:hypothetical protein